MTAPSVPRSATAPPSAGVGGVPGNNASERLSVSAASKGRFYHPIVWGRTKKWMGCLAGSTTLISKPGLLGRLSLNQRHPKAPLQTGAAPRRLLAFPPMGRCSGAWAVFTPAVGALVFSPDGSWEPLGLSQLKPGSIPGSRSTVCQITSKKRSVFMCCISGLIWGLVILSLMIFRMS